MVDVPVVTKHGEFNWIELQTRDAERAVRFYTSAIGWTFKAEDMPSGGTYWIGFASETPVCGVLTNNENLGDVSDRWFAYVHIDDVDREIANVEGLGGEVIRPPWDVPGVGRIALIRDPGGAEIGWVAPI